jgi:photosystem II stability/assembly factor-like uncharacterized protein
VLRHQRNASKSRGYGSYLHKTTNGGSSWSVLTFAYEMVFDEVAVVSEDELWIGGATIGILGAGRVWSSTDGGKTLTMHKLVGAGTGILMGLSIAPDGKSGFASTVSPEQTTAVWHFQA